MRRWVTVVAGLLIATSAVAAPRVYDTGSWASLTKAHAGRAAIVHFWGTSCAPCLTELPEWAKLARTYPSARLIFVQADPMPSHEGTSVLRQAGLGRMESWVFAPAANQERLRFEADPRWRGELPKTVLIAPDGTTTPLRNGTDFARIRDWLERVSKASGVDHIRK